MRQFEDVERRWSQLFNTSIGVDLRQAVRENSQPDPCENGLRSVCWRAFLLYGPLSKGSWTKKLAESRGAYASLRDHFLKFINNPNDLQSSADPLADDDNDEQIREEIFQDVTRCMQDNYFFREPPTQRKLLDILFIYSKLNPDIGYRQGMHELLAPVLWTISQDVIDVNRVSAGGKAAEGSDFMLEVLDKKYVEHDSFSLFCAIMQTAKSFYEMGDNNDSAAIIAQSNRIHYDLLGTVDPDLANHLQVVGVLPQIYSIRWIRLLFGREFEFKDVLKIWDSLFAESLGLEVVDMTCVAMLLRIRWQLIDADYTTAITRLTKLDVSSTEENPRLLVQDAIYLIQNRTAIGGADIVQRRTGQRPKGSNFPDDLGMSPTTPASRMSNRWNHTQSSPSRSPGRFGTPQRQLENLFQEVSGNLQRRTEGWSKTVRGAVGEVRKNMNNFQATHSRGPSIEGASGPVVDSHQALQTRIRALGHRNKALAKMLDGALESLRASRSGNGNATSSTEDVFNMALARIQFVSVYLADPDIPIPSDMAASEAQADTVAESIAGLNMSDPTTDSRDPKRKTVLDQAPPGANVAKRTKEQDATVISQGAASPDPAASSKNNVRPSLADSSFSFMLGENRKRSSFVSSASELPEQRRDSESRSRPPRQLWNDGKDKPQTERGEDRTSEDGFTLSALG